MGSIKISVKYTVTGKVDNGGAIFMANNITTMSLNKHADIRHKYVNEYIEDRIIKIIFVLQKMTATFSPNT